MTQAPRQQQCWIPVDSVPDPLESDSFVLEPLHPRHAELDFAALMSCRTRLHRELGWGTWPPPGFTLELNRIDLGEHYDEFAGGQAFAYTVLSVDRSRCIGCIYLERCDDVGGAQLAFWVIDDVIDIETRLVTEVVRWIHEAWSIERVLIPLRNSNPRGIAMAINQNWSAWPNDRSPTLSEHRCFLSR